VGDALGRGYHYGFEHGEEYPRDAGMDYSQLRVPIGTVPIYQALEKVGGLPKTSLGKFSATH